jgi:hypothetical protein
MLAAVLVVTHSIAAVVGGYIWYRFGTKLAVDVAKIRTMVP